MTYPLIKIGDSGLKIADGNYSSKYPSKKEFVESGIPFIRANNFDNQTINDDELYFITEEKHSKITKGHLKYKDVLITTRGNIGQLAIVPNRHINSNINAQIVLLRSNHDWFPEFLIQALSSDFVQNQFQRLTTGTALKQLSVKNLKQVKIPLPPLKTQQRIAGILDDAAALRNKTAQLLKEYDLLAQSIFLEMFGDPGVNPKNWKIEKFGKYIDILTDYHANGSYQILNKNVELFSDKDYALMVRTTDLENNNFEKGVNYISETAYKFLSKSKVYGGEIIMNKIGSAGKIYLMPCLKRPVSLGMNAFMLRLNENMNTLFAYFYLTTKFGEWQISKRVKGAVTKTIRKDAVRAIPIIVPPINLQNQFAEKIALIEQQKKLAKQELQESEDLFNCLLQKAFKGELV